MAALIVTIMLIPQSLAYAMLAGLPPEVGLYASILPLVAYALFGTSRPLAVGPVAVVSLMTASAVGEIVAQGTAGYLTAAAALALLSGAMLVLMGLLRLGFLANFLSHPVISGFITASGILIAASQLKHILGVAAGGDTLPGILAALAGAAAGVNLHTVAVGLGVLAFLLFARTRLKPVLTGLGLGRRTADLLTKAAPILAVALTILLAKALDPMILHELIDYETLRVVWWLLLGVLLIGFAVMDGFDLGTATLLPFVAKTDVERRVVIKAVGPVWEGNQVWLFGIIATVGLSMFPFILPSSIDPRSSLTVWDASSSHLTLFIMLVVTAIFVPLVVAYMAWVYRVLWGKVDAKAISGGSGHAY